ncbi:MAG: hypothetical protein DI587_17010 [Variovorax paradoxus]|nr:MAG: hypothetical protein DI583_17010 [Variovorax paradoxus]PZQ08935.1 MAG: hypothetical protein DI587_17010 [Variovorax paradoxus]
MQFDQAFAQLLGHEGDYVDHPADPGSATRWGITQRVAREHGYLGDMRKLPQEAAKAIARKAYWEPVQADSLPPSLRYDVFDAAYNSGVRQAVRWLQRAVFVADDGIFGPKTMMAAQSYNGAAIAARFNGHRLQMLTDLVAWKDFGKGWSRRVAAILIAAKG